jgi:hypothetical protein
MPLLTGAVRFNGAEGSYSILLEDSRYEKEVRIDAVRLWDAFEDGMYYQSDFGSPTYRRPAPFSIAEGAMWLEILRTFASTGSSDATFRIPSIAGNTTVRFVDGWLNATTSTGNVTEFGPPVQSETMPVTLRVEEAARIDFTLPFDLAIGVPRAQITVGGKPINVLIDTGNDHSLFSNTLPHEELGVSVKVGGMGGTDEFTLGSLRDIEIGGAHLSEITPFFTSFDKMPGPLRMLRGIIGQDILARSTITIDQRRNVIVGRAVAERPLTWPLDGPYTVAVVDGVEAWYRIDTGSQFTLHKFSREQPPDGRTSTHYGIGGGSQTRSLKVGSVVLDDATFSNVQGHTHYSQDDPEVVAGNIGNKLLKELDVTMDFAGGTARFAKRQ